MVFRTCLEVEDYNLAEEGFLENRKSVNKNTRIYLEATALLAICYLRTNQYESAKPLIQEVLKNDKVIKTQRTRQIFNKNIIQRFDEEVALFSMREKYSPKFDVEEIHIEVGKLISTKNEDEIYRYLGLNTPIATKQLIFDIDNFAKNQLSYTERRLLPSSKEVIKDEQAGRTVFSSFKRVIYNSVCDPNSEVYKAWYTNLVSISLDKKYLVAAIVSALSSVNIGIKALIVSAVALVIRLGLDVYCDYFKPISVMEARKG